MEELINKNNETEAIEEFNPQSGVVIDEELEDVAGGVRRSHDSQGRKLVQSYDRCEHWECCFCKMPWETHTSVMTEDGPRGRCSNGAGDRFPYTCRVCNYVSDLGYMYLLCNHPANHY